MDDHTFCRSGLRVARQMAEQAKVKVPRLSTWGMDQGFSRYYEVRDYNTGRILWQGIACCAYEARGNAIISMIPDDAVVV